MKRKKNKHIGLITSVHPEGKYLTARLKPLTKISGNSPAFYTGRLFDKDIVCVISGIGKTNAAHGATLIVHNYAPELIINFGAGGAYPSSGLKAGDLAVAEKEIYGDEGVLTDDGFQGAVTIGIPFLKKGAKKYYNEFPLDKRILKKAVISSKNIANVRTGRFITVSSCTGTRQRALSLESAFSAICENMEGAAVAHICALYGIPMLEIRGISNMAGDRNKEKWDIAAASENCCKAVLELLKTPLSFS